MSDVSAARSFGSAAQAYDRIRPPYPTEAVRFAVDGADPGNGEPRGVLDLGAGTGILTRELVRLGHRVTAVDPDPQMLARLTETTDGVRTVEGSAEATGLPAASVDVVTCGQSYHWFDPPKALPEIARVLRPGGVLAPIWNLRDESVPWVAALTRVTSPTDGSSSIASGAVGDVGPWFGRPERREFRHLAVRHTVDSLLELFRSRSYYLVGDAARRAEIEDGIRRVAADLPAEFDLPYVTVVYRARVT